MDKQNSLEQQTQHYLQAFDDADIDALIAVMQAAETDSELTDSIVQLHEEPEMQNLLPFNSRKHKRKNSVPTSRRSGWKVAAATLLVGMLSMFAIGVGNPTFAEAILPDMFDDNQTSCERATIPEAECDTLVELYNVAGGDNWHRADNWLTNENPCSWYGINCTQENVTRISLGVNNLHGTMPDLSALTHLKTLNMTGFKTDDTYEQVSRTPPLLIGALPEALETLNLMNGEFVGGLDQLRNLQNLTYLNLSHNQFEGSISAISDLGHLEYLNLSNNHFHGQLLHFRMLPMLEQINVSFNQFSGQIVGLENLPNLRTLDVSVNQLSGPYPIVHRDVVTLLNVLYVRHIEEERNHFSTPHETRQVTSIVPSVELTAQEVLDTYLRLLSSGNVQTAYRWYSTGVPRSFRPNYTTFRQQYEREAWKYMNYSIYNEVANILRDSRFGGKEMMIDGNIIYDDGRGIQFFEAKLHNDGNGWRMMGFVFSETADE